MFAHYYYSRPSPEVGFITYFEFDVLKTTDKDLYHVISSTRYVGGGSLGARKTTFNSAYAGRDSILNTLIGGKPGTTVLVRY